jgi:hypothetical protein
VKEMETLPEPKVCSKLDFKDLNLTMREFKGYSFEVEVQNLLSNLGYAFEANPVSEHAWKHDNIHHKVDIVLANGLRIECKNIDAKIYLSWFKRDWLPKGSCVFVFKGDLKLSPAIIEQYHPILLHYSLLHVYLNYNLPLFRGVTSLSSLYQPITTKNYLEVEEDVKTPTENVEAEKFVVEKCRKNIEAPSKGAPIPSSSLQVKTWKLEGVGDSTHPEISESFSISIISWKGEP